MKSKLIGTLLFICFCIFLSSEVILISKISTVNEKSNFQNMILLTIVRLLASFGVIILLAVFSTQLAHQRRILVMNSEWLRNGSVSDKLPSYLLTVFEQLIAFHYMARLRIAIDAAFAIVLLTYLASSLSLKLLAVMTILGLVGAALAVAFYFCFSIVSRRTTETENEIVECAKLANERGTLGWTADNLSDLLEKFTMLSLRLTNFLSIRYSISGILRVIIEFAVFVLVAAGILISNTEIITTNDRETEILILLILSRIAPILFSIFSQVSTLGFGSSAKSVYITR